MLIEELLPASVAAVEAFTDLPVDLFPEEAAVVARAVDKRRREFATVRHCARVALARLGIPAVPLVPGDRGAPAWPAGVVGSMTHCAGYRAAAVAHGRDVSSVGIDAEPNGPTPPGVLEEVAGVEEQAWVSALCATRPGVSWDRLLFSAKESVYKAWYPLTRRWLGFEQAVISVDPDAGTFLARLLVPGPSINGTTVTEFPGRWLAREGLVVTAIALPGPGDDGNVPADGP